MAYTFKSHIQKRLKELEFDRDNIDGVILLLEDDYELEKQMYDFLNNTKLTPDSRDVVFKYARYISGNWYTYEGDE